MWICRFPQHCSMLHLEKQPGIPNIAFPPNYKRMERAETRRGTKKQPNCTVCPSLSVFLMVSTTNEGGPNPQKKHLEEFLLFVFLSCWTLIFRMRIHHLSLSKHGTRDPELSISLQVNGFPLIATEHLLWLRPSPHVAKLPSGVPVPGAPISYLQRSKKWSRVNRPTAEVPTLLFEYKIPNMGSKHPPQLSDPPFIAGQHMLLPPTSALPISQHCPAERPAPHSARRARSMQPCPATASCGRSWRQPALSTGSSCSASCSPPNQRYNWIANKPFPKKYTPKGKIRKASTNSNRPWGKGGTHQTLKEEKTTDMYSNVSTNQQTSRFYQDLWLSVWLHKRTRCCHPQWKCYRPLKSIRAANSRDQRHRHQLLDYLHPNVPTCAAACWFQRIFLRKAAFFLKKRFDNWHALLKTQNWIWNPCMNTPHISCIISVYHSISYICNHTVYMHLYRNRINLSNKNHSDMMAKSLDSDTGLEYRAWS